VPVAATLSVTVVRAAVAVRYWTGEAVARRVFHHQNPPTARATTRTLATARLIGAV